MKLLSPTAVKDLTSEQLARDVIRAEETGEVIKEMNAAHAKAEADFSATLAAHQARWEEEERQHVQEVATRLAEVEGLEARRKQALEPIEFRDAHSRELFEEAQTVLASARAKEEKCGETQEILESRLDEVGEREITLRVNGERLESRKKGTERQEEATQAGSRRLSEEIQEFYTQRTSQEADLAERRKNLDAREASLVLREKRINDDSEALRLKEISLEDQRMTLQREFNRLKPMHKNDVPLR